MVDDSPRRLPIHEPSASSTARHEHARPNSPAPAPLHWAKRSPTVRFEDFPQPSTSRVVTTSSNRNKPVQSFRSAALETLLPVAASEGIVRQVCLVSRRSPTPVASHSQLKSSNLEICRLYHGGNICAHKAARYTASANPYTEEDFQQQLERASVDGAVEIRERNGSCWKCRFRRSFRPMVRLLCCSRRIDNVKGDGGREEEASIQIGDV